MKLSPYVILRVYIPFASGFFISYLYRVVNAVIAPELTNDLGIGSSALGLLTSAYLISFAVFQLPLGVLLDRFSPKKVNALLLLFAGLGAFIFSRADSLAGLIFGRALIGLGVSACLMAAFKAYVIWFPPDKLPLMNGFQMVAGGLGALMGTAPVDAALQLTDWRGIFTYLAVLTIVIAGLVYFVVPRRKIQSGPEDFGEQLSGLKHVLTSRIFWKYAPFVTMAQSTGLAIMGLWAGLWLKDVAGLSRALSANVLLWMSVSMMTGYILFGLLAERINKLGISTLTVSLTGLCVFMGIQLIIILEFTARPHIIWILFDFFGSSGILSYAGLTHCFSPNLSGRVTTALNGLVFVSAFAFQWVIGAIISLWQETPSGGYAPAGYRAGFIAVLSLQVISLLWFCLESIKGRGNA